MDKGKELFMFTTKVMIGICAIFILSMFIGIIL